MSLIIQHRWNVTGNLTQCIILNNNECNTCRSQILLCTTINTDIFRNVNRTWENIRRHIGNHWNRRIEVFLQFCTVNRVVSSDVEIICVCRDCVIFWDISICSFSRGSNFYNFTKPFSFFHCFLSPHTSVQVSSFFFQEVIRNHAELHTSTSTQEQYRITFGDIE